MRIKLMTLILGASLINFAQDDWDFGGESDKIEPAFNDTRVINGHSTEVLEEKTLDLRITHKFGDIAVPNSGRTLFGLDVSTDIRIAFEYGLTDKLDLGFGRSKGAGPFSQLWDGLIKYQLMNQTEGKPVSLTLVSSAFFTSMQSNGDSTSIINFDKTAHRFSYATQAIVSKSFNNKVSAQLNAGWLHRNLVSFNDENDNLFIGASAKAKVYKKMSFIAEYYHLFRSDNVIDGVTYVDPFSVGVEFKTNAHVFLLNFMNAPGIGEAQFLPTTTQKWSEGEFRFGFTISRHF